MLGTSPSLTEREIADQPAAWERAAALAEAVEVALAHERGLDPDHPRHLRRSVVLGAAQ